MKVAVVQFNARADKSDNVARACEMVERAVGKGAELVCLPETFNFRGLFHRPEDLASTLESVPGPSLEPLMALAARHRAAILAGSIFEKVRTGAKAYNSSVLIGPDGRVQALYRKIHLFDAILGKKVIRESSFFVAGKTPVLSRVGGFTVGMSVCYDLRFPDLYRRYGRRGAQILTVPSCFTRATGEAHWEVLLRARAIENQCYVLAPNQIGPDGRGIESYGHSMIVGPWGDVLARASADREEIIFAELSAEELARCRSILPSLGAAD